MDEVDIDYLRRELGTEPLTVPATQAGLPRARQAGSCPRPEDLDDVAPLRAIARHVRPMAPERRDGHLRALHLKLAEKDWVRSAHGDVTGQLGLVTG
jgi:CO dehydrogenase maturation factor